MWTSSSSVLVHAEERIHQWPVEPRLHGAHRKAFATVQQPYSCFFNYRSIIKCLEIIPDEKSKPLIVSRTGNKLHNHTDQLVCRRWGSCICVLILLLSGLCGSPRSFVAIIKRWGEVVNCHSYWDVVLSDGQLCTIWKHGLSRLIAESPGGTEAVRFGLLLQPLSYLYINVKATQCHHAWELVAGQTKLKHISHYVYHSKTW